VARDSTQARQSSGPSKGESVLGILRQAATELDRPTLVLLLSAACLPVVYVYQGSPEFYLAHLGRLDDPLAPLYAQLWRFGAVAALFFLVPALAYRLVARRPLSELGLCVGRPGAGLRTVGLLLLPLLLLLWISSADPAFLREYPMARVAAQSPGRLVAYELAYGLYYLGWEFLFRGALQLGLRHRLGFVGACMIQLLPSVLLHIGKPVGETWGALVAAPVFGAVAVRSGSFLPLFLLHWCIGVANDLMCAARQGLLTW